MPQKKNPVSDFSLLFQLQRDRRLTNVGFVRDHQGQSWTSLWSGEPLMQFMTDIQMSAVVVALKGLPTTYNKDMAEDKDHLFDCVRTVQDVVRIMEGVVATLNVSSKSQ